MQKFIILTALLLVAGVSAEQPQEVSNAQPPAPVQAGQPSHVAGHTVAVEGSPQAGVGGHQHFANGQMVNFEQPPMGQPHGAPHYYSPSGMIHVVGSPAGGAAASGEQAPNGGVTNMKPVAGASSVATVRHYSAGSAEQYGQPESASIPPNYKPFGSWGLYIGGNPADGYYSNYYKALGNSVADKQQAAAGAEPKPAASQSFVGQASGFGSSGASPMMRQAGGSSVYPQTVAYQDQSYYPYGEYYTPADFNSGSRVTVQNQAAPAVYSSGSFGPEYQGAQAQYQGAQAQPMQQQQPQGAAGAAAMYYADSYAATKKTAPQAFAAKDVQAPMSPAKGYFQQQQQRMGYSYASPASFQAPVAAAGYQSVYQAAQPPQVVAYPVPVGSQMVGSQPGVEGAFQPYGVHGFTRYAVKPTVVASEQTYYSSGAQAAPVSNFPVYKQQMVGFQQPMSFYGYPISQISHYAPNAVSPAFGQQPSGAPMVVGSQGSSAQFSTGVQHPVSSQQGVAVVDQSGPVMHGPGMSVEAASSEKSETNSEADKQQVNKPQHQQKKA